MKCWICGADALSREHRTKASDIRALFGDVSQHAPLYLHIGDRKNIKIQSVNSDKLKFEKRLCSTCNNARTQPHDMAWQKLSEHLRSRKPPTVPGTVINLGKVFPGEVSKSMLYVHLYFLKVFGCLASDSDAPLPVSEFGESILKSQAHPHVHIAFAMQLVPPLRKATAITPIPAMIVEQSGHKPVVAYASWIYHVNGMNAVILYAHPNEPEPPGLTSYWHPSTVTKHLRMVGIEALMQKGMFGLAAA